MVFCNYSTTLTADLKLSYSQLKLLFNISRIFYLKGLVHMYQTQRSRAEWGTPGLVSWLPPHSPLAANVMTFSDADNANQKTQLASRASQHNHAPASANPEWLIYFCPEYMAVRGPGLQGSPG